MKMITELIKKKFDHTPIGSTDGKGLDAKVIVKFFNPYGSGTWLITEAEKQVDGDYLLYGYMHISDWEWGYIMLSEILNARVYRFGCRLPLERDMYSSGTVRQMVEMIDPTWCND